MDMTPREYQQYVQRKMKKSPLGKDVCLAFLVGGAICALGQAVLDGWMSLGLPKEDAGTATSCSLVALSSLLTGLNLYNKLARFGGAGTLVPITGFSNAVTSPALDFKSEGFVTGMAAKMFTVAGPVITFGCVSEPDSFGVEMSWRICASDSPFLKTGGDNCDRPCSLRPCIEISQS